jgi:hypothetical protein
VVGLHSHFTCKACKVVGRIIDKISADCVNVSVTSYCSVVYDLWLQM